MTRDEFRIRDCERLNARLESKSVWYEVDHFEPWQFLCWHGTYWVTACESHHCGGNCSTRWDAIPFRTREEAEDYISRRITLGE